MGGEINRREFIRRCLAVTFVAPAIVSFTLDQLSTPAGAAPNQTKPNQSKPNQTKPNQTKPNQGKPRPKS